VALFSYIVASDGGFAPNPYHGRCTLACCKPRVRGAARTGDWIAGLAPKALGHRLVYAMRVDGTLSFREYWAAHPEKRPDFSTLPGSLGDNAYRPLAGGGYRQIRSWHSFRDGPRAMPTAREDAGSKAHDLSVDRVLVAGRFAYWGAAAAPLPEAWRKVLAVGRGHRRVGDETTVRDWARFMDRMGQGLLGEPRHLPRTDLFGSAAGCRPCSAKNEYVVPARRGAPCQSKAPPRRCSGR